MSTACNKINLKDAKIDGVNFTNSNLSAWKSMCKYYSGNADCMPNQDVLKKVTKIEALNWEVDFADYPVIEGSISAPNSNYDEWLKICSDENAIINECSDIDFEFFNNDLLQGNSWTAATKDAKCTEIGYLYGLPCKQTKNGAGEGKKVCEKAETCEELEMYLESENYSSTDFCRSLGCAKTSLSTLNSCVDFVTKDQFKFEEINNEGMSLADINAHCMSIEKVLDLSIYSDVTHNFEDNDAVDVCVDIKPDIDLNSIDASLCEIVGAINGVQTDTNSSTCAKSDTEKQCEDVTFTLNRFYEDQVGPIKKIATNAFYDSEKNSFGEQLCNSLKCSAGTADSSVPSRIVYTCGDAPTEAPTDAPTDGTTGANPVVTSIITSMIVVFGSLMM